MILSFKIKNFWSFKDEVLFTMEAEPSKLKSQNVIDIDLPNANQVRVLKIAMIYGANASGKSNLIRALYYLINYIARKPQVGAGVWMYEPFLFDRDSRKRNTEFELVFIGPQNIKYIYQVTFNQNQIESESLNYFPNGKTTNLFTRNASADKSTTIHDGVLGDSFGKREIKVFSNQLLLSKFGDDEPVEELSNIFLFLKKYEVTNATNYFHRNTLKGQVDEMVLKDSSLNQKLNALIRFADTKLQGFHITKEEKSNETKEEKIGSNTKSSSKEKTYAVYGLHRVYENSNYTGIDQLLPFVNESIGTQALYSLGGKVLSTLTNGGALIVDELDTSLHPFITRMLILMFQSEKINPHNAQLIFTSHDMTLLDRDLIRKDQVWLAEKSEEGISELFSLQDFEGVREETPFDKWYLAGKFGGLPTLKSIDSIFEKDVSNS